MSFGQRLRGLRRDLDLSQAELADRAGCSANTSGSWSPTSARPSRELATRLAEVLEIWHTSAPTLCAWRAARRPPAGCLPPSLG